MDKIIHTVADWIVNDPERAAELMVATVFVLGGNVLLSFVFAQTVDSKVASLARQLREKGINVWENKP